MKKANDMSLSQAAAIMGRAKSAKKTAANRRNGKLGGRPRKNRLTRKPALG